MTTPQMLRWFEQGDEGSPQPGDAPLQETVLSASIVTGDPARVDAATEAEAGADLSSLPERYQTLGPIARGGMGAVHRVWDGRLERAVAMKILHPHLREAPQLRARFLEEARGTARLQHPGIVAVHDLGELPDGRLWFAMREIEGQTLTAVIREVHGALGEAGRADPMGLRRLVRLLVKAAEALAYAHSRGVLHRDVKPDNIMVGPFGEVLILDWGLARFLDRPRSSGGVGPVQTEAGAVANLTEYGQIIGTPAYMSPAQARGEPADFTSDVHALGAILFEVLTGRPAFVGKNPMMILGAVLRGERGAFPAVGGLPPGLVDLCDRAMGQQPGVAVGSAETFAQDLQGWLDGAERRAEALTHVEAADGIWAEVEALRRGAEAARREATARLRALPSFAPVEEKAGAWAQEEAALTLERQAYLKELGYLQRLHGALSQVPELPEALGRLADHYQGRHRLAEARGQEEEALRLLSLLTRYDRGRHRTYLSGEGALTLRTDPPGARVSLFAHHPEQRRLVPRFVADLGETPIAQVRLPMGSYLLRIHAPGREAMDCPIVIERGGHWTGEVPGAAVGAPIPLLRAGALREGEIVIPPGVFFSGGDPDAYRSLPGRWIWVDGFIIQRFPVTQGQYYAFLNDLLEQGREGDALRWAPRERGGLPGEGARAYFGRDEAGRFHPVPDASGLLFPEDWPCLMVDWHGARAFAAWRAAREGLPWRLPWELEWEKAARGVDRRRYPWGNGYDPALSNVHGSQAEGNRPCPVSDFPLDRSAYGVQGMGGNVHDWCLDAFREEGPELSPEGRFDPALQPIEDEGQERVVRGGSYTFHEKGSRVCLRPSFAPYLTGSILGFRLVRPLVCPLRPSCG